MLTDAQIKRTRRAKNTTRLYDGHGLVYVLPSKGMAYWRFDFRLDGKRRSMSLGTYHDVTLAKARAKLLEARALVADGVDPVAARRAVKVAPPIVNDFAALAEEWYQVRTGQLAEQTRYKKRWLLDAFIIPAFGDMSTKAIKASDVLTMLRGIEKKGLHETTLRAKQVTSEILRYGIATDRAESDCTRDLLGALQTVTPTHRAALTAPKPVGALLRAIDSLESDVLRGYLQLLALTFVRPGELRMAQWPEVDEKAKEWRVPASRTKQRTEHIVPLCRQAIAIFKTLRVASRGSRYVFPTPRTIQRHLSDAAAAAALARIGYGPDVMTPHGFRAMARTLLDEQLHQTPEVIEAQLAHVTPGALGTTYNRSRYLAQRVALMSVWGDYLDELRKGAVD